MNWVTPGEKVKEEIISNGIPITNDIILGEYDKRGFILINEIDSKQIYNKNGQIDSIEIKKEIIALTHEKINTKIKNKIMQKIYSLLQPTEKTEIPTLSLMIEESTNWLKFAETFVNEHGIYYDKNKIWYFWNKKEYCWEIVDETDVLNTVDIALQNNSKTVQNSIKSQIVEALKRRARLNKPKEPKEYWLQFKNKIIDIETNEEFNATKEYFFSNPINYELGETEETPVMDKLFTEWVGETNKELLYEIVSYCLSSKYFIHNIFCFTGSGSNGKSKYLHIIKNLIGNKNVCSTDLDLLSQSKFESSKLYKKLVAMMGETNYSTMKRTSLLKRLTGQDLVGIEFKGKIGFDTENYAKIIIATNTLPVTEDKTEGYYRRWLIVDFPNKFSNDIDVLKLIPEIEYNNLARKSVRFLKKLIKNRKFTNEPTIKEKTKKYEEKSNPITSFLTEKYFKNINGEEPFFQVYEEYVVYLEERGYRKPSRKEVSKLLELEGFTTEKKNVPKQDGNGYTKWVYVIGLTKRTGIMEF